MEVIYHPEAEDEVLESARFYERRGKGLGWRFLRAVEEAERRVVNSPHAFPFLDDPIRKCVLRGFPFSLLFRIEDEALFVVAVAHQHRRPGYWRARSRGRA
jgi:plasmid stabilization system protein ParE